MIERNSPLITCICLTRDRVNFLKVAIDCFLSQTYANKELLIVIRDDDGTSKKFLESYISDNIKMTEIDSSRRLSLGQLRNFAISHATGEYFCQWDDDDWYHSQRLELQMKAIQENHKEGSLLGHWLLFDKINKEAYISHYGAWAGSILCSKQIFTGPIQYPDLDKREDSEFIKKLFKLNCLYPLNYPILYIYVYHGTNTWDQNHFAHLFKYSKKLPAHLSASVSDIISGKLTNKEANMYLQQPKVIAEMDFFYFVEPSEPRVQSKKLNINRIFSRLFKNNKQQESN